MLTDSFDIQTLVIGTGAVASDIWRRSLFNRKPWKWLVKVNHLAFHSCPLYDVSSYHFLGRSQSCESQGLYSWWLSLHLCKRQPFLWLIITLPSSLRMNGLFWRAKSCVKTWLRRVLEIVIGGTNFSQVHCPGDIGMSLSICAAIFCSNMGWSNTSGACSYNTTWWHTEGHTTSAFCKRRICMACGEVHT